MERSSGFLFTAFLLGSFLMSASPVLSGRISCDKTQYPVEKNSTIIGCVDCRPCIAGSEPSVPCGTTVDDNAVLGQCQPCKDGTFSSNTDQKACQKCKNPQCLKHEIVQQNCTSTYDASRCTGHCQVGYVMNTEKRECKTDIRQKLLPTLNTTKVPPKTTAEHNKESSQMQGWLISVIAVVIILVLGILSAFICYRRRCKKVNEGRQYSLALRNPNDDSGSSCHTESLGVNRECVRPEDCPGIVTARRPHCLETSDGYAMTTTAASNNASCNGNTCGILSDRGEVQFEMQERAYEPGLVESPAPAPSAPPTFTARQQVVNPQRPVHMAAARNNPRPMVQQNNAIHNQASDMTRFESWPKDIYNEICRKINNSVAPGKDWNALVGKLNFSVQDARDFEKQKNKTDALLSSWQMERENTVAKFIDILNDMRMSVIADYINEKLMVFAGQMDTIKFRCT